MDENIDLVKRVKQGDEQAFQILLEKHHRMIYKIIYSLPCSQGAFDIDKENLFQEGSLALYNSCFSFEEGKGAKFTSYAYMNIHSKIFSYYRRNCTYYAYETFSVDSGVFDYRMSISSLKVSEDPIMYHKEQEYADYLKKFMDKLPSLDKQILELRNDDLTYKEIAKKLNVSTKKVDNHLWMMKTKFRKKMGESNDKND